MTSPRWSADSGLPFPARGSLDEARWDGRLTGGMSLVGSVVMLGVAPLVVWRGAMLAAGLCALLLALGAPLLPVTAPRWVRSAYTAYASVVITVGTIAAEHDTGLPLGAIALLCPVLVIACLRPPREVAVQGAFAMALDGGYLYATLPVGAATVGTVAAGTVMAMLAAVICGLRGRIDRVVLDLRRQAETDGLTGLHNRLGLGAALAATAPQRGALLLVDLDHFKRVNDLHGHETGDEVLVWFAGLLLASTRPGDVVGPHGGEDFLVYLPGPPSREVLHERAEQLRRAAEASSRSHGLPITVSIGAAEGDRDDLPAMLRAADRELYAAKRSGRNLVRVAVSS